MPKHDNDEKPGNGEAPGGPSGSRQIPVEQALEIALQHHGAGNLGEAEGIYRQILDVNPDHPVALHLLGVIAYQSGNNDVARDLIAKAVALQPDYAEAHNNLSNVHRELGQLEDAVACCRKAIALNPDYAEAHNNLGIALQELNRLDDAIASYEKSLAIEPDPEVYTNLGSAYQELSRLDDAVANYEKALAIHPGFAEAHNNLGKVFQELGNLEEAIASCQRSLAIHPDPEVHWNLGNLFQERSRPEDAATHYREAIALRSGYAQAHNSLGHALKELGQLDDAVTSYSEAINLKPDFPEAHYNLGSSLQKLGELESAVHSYQTAATSDARAKLLECFYTLERYEELHDTLEKFAEADKTNILVAAISVFASHQLDRENPHPYCKNPLDFVRVSSIADSAQEIDDLVGGALEELEDEYAVWEPPRVTTIAGYQTSGNVFANPEGNVAKLNDIIRREMKAYHAEFKSKKCLFTEIWPTEHRLRGWLVRLLKGGHQKGHIHPGGWVSGVIYLKIPETFKGDEGCIEFNLGNFSLPHIREDWPTKVHRPKTGDIALFPSSLFHRTIPTTTDDERISLAFDLFPA